MSMSGFYLPNGSWHSGSAGRRGPAVQQRPQITRDFRPPSRESIEDFDTLDDMMYIPSKVDHGRIAHVAREAPRIPWDKFVTEELDWKWGEHFSLIGPTGQGKTTMLINILDLHPYVTVFATKPRDITMDGLIRTGYLKLDRWRSLDPREYPKRVLWPDASRLDSVPRQKDVFHEAFGAIYREGGWTVAIDETWYMANELKLGLDIKLYLVQARALDISLVCATQRPASVPVEMYDQSTHLMFWRDNDETNLKRLAGISWLSGNLVRHLVSSLERFQALYINTRTGRMVRTRCPDVVLPQGR